MNAQTLKLLCETPRRSRREFTGTAGVERATLSKEGAHYTVTAAVPDLVTEREAWSDAAARLEPLTAELPPVDVAVLALLLQGHTTREIMAHLRVGPNRVCAVRRAAKEFL
jgi:hypothetical protein